MVCVICNKINNGGAADRGGGDSEAQIDHAVGTRSGGEQLEQFEQPGTTDGGQAEKKREMLEKSELGKLYYEFADRSINDVVEEVFESDQVKAMVTYLFLLRGNELGEVGQGYIVPVACAAGISSTISKGTSHRMAHTLNQMVIKNGGEVYEGQAAAEILQ